MGDWIEVCCPDRGPHSGHVWWESVGPGLFRNEYPFKCEGLPVCNICGKNAAHRFHPTKGFRECGDCYIRSLKMTEEVKVVVEWANSDMGLLLTDWQQRALMQHRADKQAQQAAKTGGLIPWLLN